MNKQFTIIAPLLIFFLFTSIARNSLADNVTGTCAGDGALAKQLTEMRDQGKTIDQALAMVKVKSKSEASRFAQLLWNNDDLKSMRPAEISGLTIQKCKEVKAESKIVPLSCTMKKSLVTIAAMSRDKGIPRSDMEAIFNRPDSDVTKNEADAILNVAYGSMKTVSPEKTGTAIYNLCIKIKMR